MAELKGSKTHGNLKDAFAAERAGTSLVRVGAGCSAVTSTVYVLRSWSRNCLGISSPDLSQPSAVRRA